MANKKYDNEFKIMIVELLQRRTNQSKIKLRKKSDNDFKKQKEKFEIEIYEFFKYVYLNFPTGQTH